MEEEYIPITAYLQILWRHKLLIIAITLLTMVSVGIRQQFFVDSVYRAEGTLIPKKKNTSTSSLAMSLLSTSFNLGGAADSSYDLAAILKSRMLAAYIIDNYGVQEKYETVYKKKFSRAGLIKLLAKSVAQDANKQGTVIIYYHDKTPAMAEYMANIYMRALIKISDVMAKEDNSIKIKYIEEQIVKNAAELNRLEVKLKDYEKSQNVYAIDKEMQATMSGFYALKLQYEKDRIQREALAKQYDIRIRRLEESNPLALDKASYLTDPVLQNIKTEMSKVQLEIIRNQEILKPDNPLLKQNKIKLQSLEEQLKEYTSSLQNNALNDIIFNLTSADAMLAAEKQLIENYEKSFAPLPERKLRYTRMMRDQKIYEQIYIYLKQELEKAKLDSENTIVTSRILDEAEAPSARYAPRVKLAVMIAGATGFLLGCALAFAADILLRLRAAKPAS